MATGILYTQAQVTDAQLRAQVAMYEVSQSIENGFYYIYSPVYQTYKALQYDIYTLFNVIGNEVGFVSFDSTPTTYEFQFYDLVGSLINKTKQFDVFGQFGGVLNPNAQIPGQIIVTVPVVQNYNSGTIPFSTSGTFVLNYSGYASLYGNNPTLAIYTIQGGIEQEDEQTAPIITRTGAGINSPISTITLDYPIPTVGYILIGGFVPCAAGGGGSGGGGGSVPFNFTEVDLLFDAGTAQWYLPLSLPVGKNPFYVSVNGESISTTYDTNFTPTRLYSFADNTVPQIIVVNVL